MGKQKFETDSETIEILKSSYKEVPKGTTKIKKGGAYWGAPDVPRRVGWNKNIRGWIQRETESILKYVGYRLRGWPWSMEKYEDEDEVLLVIHIPFLEKFQRLKEEEEERKKRKIKEEEGEEGKTDNCNRGKAS